VNRTAPKATIVDAAADISPDSLAVIGTLVRTYDAQRLRLLELAAAAPGPVADSPLRPLSELEPAVVLDGAPVSASIVDAVQLASNKAGTGTAGTGLALPLPQNPVDLAAAAAGWWDALLGDIERRTGLSPRSITVSLPADAADEIKAVFADRLVA
jgi:hypothetical protein